MTISGNEVDTVVLERIQKLIALTTSPSLKPRPPTPPRRCRKSRRAQPEHEPGDGPRGRHLIWWDPETEAPILTYEDQRDRANRADASAEAEREARMQAEERARRTKEELRRLRGEELP